MSGRHIHTAAILMIAAVISRFLGYGRDILLVSFFGQGALTDAYYAAFTLPDFLYGMVVGGVLGPVFIPIFSSYLALEKQEDGWIVANTLLNMVLLVMGFGMAIGFLLAPQIINLLVPGFDPTTALMAVKMTRIMLLQSLMMALGGLCMGVLNSFGHYGAPAIGSAIYNLATIVIGLLLAPIFGITGFAIAVTGGAICYLVVQLPALCQTGWHYQFQLQWRHPGVRKIGRMLLPITLGLSVNQINFLVNQSLASLLSEGLLTALRMAQRLMQLPIGIFAINIAIAIFTTMTAQASRNDTAAFKFSLQNGLAGIIMLSVPAAAGMVALKGPLIALFYDVGNNSVRMVSETANILAWYCLGLLAYASLHLLNRAFYAMQDTRTPMILSAVAVAVNIGLSLLLMPHWQQYGLAMAYSLAGIANMSLLLVFLRKRIGPFGGKVLSKILVKSVFCSGVMMLAVAICTHMICQLALVDSIKVEQLLAVTIGVIIGTVTYGCLMKWMGLGYWLNGIRKR